MSQIQVDNITNAAGTGSPTFPFGLTDVPGLGSGGVVVPGGYPFTVTALHRNKVVLVDTTSARTINMPAHLAGFLVTFKDVTGSAAANNITLVRFGGTGNIEGVAASYVLNQNRIAITFISDGSNWHAIA